MFMVKAHIRQLAVFAGMTVFALIILSISMLRQSHVQVEQKLGDANPSPAIKVQLQLLDQVPRHSNYVLPGPGILPTHPAYTLKMVADRIKLVTAFPPARKAELLLHYANIRIAAADALVLQGFVDRAVSTATKGEIYLSQAIRESDSIPAAKKDAWLHQLEEAVVKHEEIIERIHILGTDETKNQTKSLKDNLGLMRNQLAALTGRPFIIWRPEDDENIPVRSATSSAEINTPTM